MAAGILPAPGSELGPCDVNATCGHLDCQATVKEAHSACRICEKPIGYDERMYVERPDDHPDGFPMPTTLAEASGKPYICVHAVCVEMEIEQAAGLETARRCLYCGDDVTTKTGPCQKERCVAALKAARRRMGLD